METISAQGYHEQKHNSQSLYDANNIFARILRKEAPCREILETAHTLVFHDVSPKAPLHALIIPKGAYIHAHDFFTRASDEEILDFSRTVGRLPHLLGAQDHQLKSHAGVRAGQEVSHFHVHFLGFPRASSLNEVSS